MKNFIGLVQSTHHFQIEKWRTRKISHFLKFFELVRSSLGTVNHVASFLTQYFFYYSTFFILFFCFRLLKKGRQTTIIFGHSYLESVHQTLGSPMA